MQCVLCRDDCQPNIAHTVIVQPLYTMSTSHYFKMRQNGFTPQLDTLMEEDCGVPLKPESGGRESLQNVRRTSRETPSPETGQTMRNSARRRMVNYLKNVTTRTSSSSTVEGSTSTPSLDEKQQTPSASPEVFVFTPPDNEYCFAIQEIHVCVHGLWMCVANMGGGVMVFDFKMGEVATTPKVSVKIRVLLYAVDILVMYFLSKLQSLDICFNYDSILNPEGISSTSSCPIRKPFDDWFLREGIRDSLPGFNLIQHCWCYYGSSETESTPTIVSSMRYSSEIGM